MRNVHTDGVNLGACAEQVQMRMRRSGMNEMLGYFLARRLSGV